MLVTREQLKEHGLQQNPSWFSRHFKNSAIEWRLGKSGLQNVYDTEYLKTYTVNYLKRIKKLPHLRRHNSPERFMELLQSIENFEVSKN